MKLKSSVPRAQGRAHLVDVGRSRGREHISHLYWIVLRIDPSVCLPDEDHRRAATITTVPLVLTQD
jgi:hypothetical protein